ncbi:hypothetical protein ACFV9C_30935 [Kribbella sp. NPDC059898]|uniref:hypothetical protein n=1 Tax=Kribbella sp. NPDC059898 TaxID=3346995 RepID=UPI003659EE3D
MTTAPEPPALQPIPSTSLLAGLDTGLLIHTAHRPKKNGPTAGVQAIRDLLARERVGVVYAMPGADASEVASTVHHTRAAAPDAVILLDADRYTGARRKLAGEGLSDGWVEMQHRLGLRWALTDSGYVAAGDREGLRTILHQAARLQQHSGPDRGVLAGLPLAKQWLTDDADALISEIMSASIATALMLEDPQDPLATRGAVSGLISVLGCELAPGLLRCDMSALGALAYGASLVAVGDHSSRRHFTPVPDPTKPQFGYAPKPAMLVPELLGYFHLAKIELAITAAPALSVWKCACGACGGTRLDTVINSVDPPVRAFEHSVSSLARLGRQLFAESEPVWWREKWNYALQDAQVAHEAIISIDHPWEAASALGAWVSQFKRAYHH